MIIEDIKYQVEQFSNFDNVRLVFSTSDENGIIYCKEGKIAHAVFGAKKDLDAFKELNETEGSVSIEVNIGEPPPVVSLDKTFNEIMKLIGAAEAEEPEDYVQSFPSTDYDAGRDENISQVDTKAITSIGENLANIPGVEGVLVVNSSGGKVIYSKGIEDIGFDSADTIFLYEHGKNLGNIIDFKNLKSLLCEAHDYKKIIMNDNNIIYSLKISSAVQPLKTQMEAVKLLESGSK